MAKKTPPLVIPVTVDASGVSKGLNDVNNRLKRGTGGTVTGSGIGGIGQAGGFVAQGTGGSVAGGAAADYFASRAGTAAAIGGSRFRGRGAGSGGEAARTRKEEVLRASSRHWAAAGGTTVAEVKESMMGMEILQRNKERQESLKTGLRERSAAKVDSWHREVVNKLNRREAINAQLPVNTWTGMLWKRDQYPQKYHGPRMKDGKPVGSTFLQRGYEQTVQQGMGIASAMSPYLGAAAAAAGGMYLAGSAISQMGGGVSNIEGFRGDPTTFRQARRQELREFQATRRGERRGFFDSAKGKQLNMTGGNVTAGEAMGGALGAGIGKMGEGLGWAQQKLFDMAFSAAQTVGLAPDDASMAIAQGFSRMSENRNFMVESKKNSN